ncbi:winged helix-turn-helix transcriptional regulator [Natrialbaceae archaeon A-CW2]|uniref:winged helix-turn-helix transcriptional regulator n=1 Tax=Natronosalvus amylolyticus TaxID=2961994 RepID=UPI0020C9AE40|nr:winged helix-turn-helix transcriptional regulator [Natronosalvus amylolyticus]
MAHDGVDLSTSTRTALDALAVLSNKWHPVVLAVLHDRGPMGFNELLNSIPDISGKVLTDTLGKLQDAGLVERTVLNESPLRVRYELTTAGTEFEAVFDALSGWGEAHLETAIPSVLLADGDRRITDMYRQWLDGQYTLTRAHTGEELVEILEEERIDVMVIDADLPGLADVDRSQLSGSTWRTILLVESRPGFDVLEIPCDDVRRKPIVQETASKAIDLQLERQGEPPAYRELAALQSKRSLFQSVYATERLESNDRYLAMGTQIETLEEQLETPAELQDTIERS